MPMALPFIALGMAAAGTAMTVVGKLRQGAYEQQVANNNAMLTGQNATTAALKGEAERTTLTRIGSETISSQRARAGTSGADVGAPGSIVDVLSATRMLNKMDLARSSWNTGMEVRGYGIQASSLRARGEMARYAGNYGAASSLITGLGSMASSAYKMSGGGGGADLGLRDYADSRGVEVDNMAPIYDPEHFPSFGP